MSNITRSKESVRNFAEAWDQEARKDFPTNYPVALSTIFTKYKVSTILDCAGGTGYPSIELKRMGWDISYSDGSETMFDFFTEKVEAANIDIPKYLSRWENLSENVPDTYDALLCCGNSFIGINGYDSGLSVIDDTVKENMVSAVSEFYKKLNSGGVLYIDLLNAESAMPEQPYCRGITTDTHRFFRTVSYDPVTNIRSNFTTKTSLVDGSVTDAVAKVIPLFAEDLINLLLEAGFSRVEHSPVETADYIDGFFAFKD